MNSAEFMACVNWAFAMLKNRTPKDSGNLRDNAVRIVWKDEDTAEIYIDEDVAPYMPYTNEPWVSAYWKGKKNPNLYWFDLSVEYIVNFLAAKYGGTVSRRSGNADKLNIKKLAKKFQNKSGDLFPEDIWVNSEYISRQKNGGVTFAERYALINNHEIPPQFIFNN